MQGKFACKTIRLPSPIMKLTELKTFQIALFFGLLTIVAKLVVYGFDFEYRYTIFSNLLLVLASIFFSIRNYKFQNSLHTSFGNDFKEGLKAGVVFALVVAAVAYVYYGSINPEFLQEKIDERIVLAENANVDSLIQAGRLDASMTKEQLVIREQENVSKIYSPFYYSTLSLVGYIIVGAIYSIFMTLIIRRAPGIHRP